MLTTALFRFAASRNTLITVKPAHSLQITGIYAHSRNPMYLGLVLLYAALAIFKGNTWTLVLLPVLIVAVQVYVIRKEEAYLEAAFGSEYRAYRKRVRRWL